MESLSKRKEEILSKQITFTNMHSEYPANLPIYKDNSHRRFVSPDLLLVQPLNIGVGHVFPVLIHTCGLLVSFLDRNR